MKTTTRKRRQFDEAQVLALLAARSYKLRDLLAALVKPEEADYYAYASGDLGEFLQQLKMAGKVQLIAGTWALSGRRRLTIEMDNSLLANEELTILLQKHNGQVL